MNRRSVVLAPLILPWLGCATVPAPIDPVDPDTAHGATLAARIDWDAVGEAAFADLAAYLQVDTVNPPGHERRGAAFLAELLAAHGIPSELIDHGNDRASLIARVPATTTTTGGPICLVSHIDVVTSEAQRWPAGKGPLSGAIVDEDGVRYVYGRGALDMKGMAMMELHALFALIDSKVERTRDIVVVAVADEEVDSVGMEAIVSDEHWGKVGCTHAVNEGGLGLKDAIVPGQTVFAISVGERGVLWSRVVAEGPPGHGSTPIPGRAPEKLLRAMNRLAAWRDEPKVHPALQELLAAVGREAGGAQGFVLERPALVDLLVLDRLQEKPTTKAITNDTIHLTGFGGAEQPNVVPSTVFAQYDVRLLPGTSSQDMEREIKALLSDIDGVRLEVLERKEPNESEWRDDPFFAALRRNVVIGVERAVAGPMISPGFTDSILLRRRGVRAYGVIPVVVDAQESARMHGDAERISRDNVTRGTRVLFMTLADVVARCALSTRRCS